MCTVLGQEIGPCDRCGEPESIVRLDGSGCVACEDDGLDEDEDEAS